jgi:hypothetical protein
LFKKLISRGTPLETVGLIMPSDFPTEDYNAVHVIVRAHHDKHSAFHQDYGGAWNAVAYRFQATIEYCDEFRAALRIGTSPQPDGRCLQEKLLFGMFGSSFSFFEATCYAIYALGFIVAGDAIPLRSEADRKKVTFARTTAAFRSHFPNEPLTLAMNATWTDPNFKEVHRLRNLLVHRAAPGRTHHQGGAPRPTDWKATGQPLDEIVAQGVRDTTANLAGPLIGAIKDFVTSHIK